MNYIDQDYDKLIKIIILGDSCIGKSSLCNSLSGINFQHSYVSTLGVDFFCLYYKNNSKTFKLQIWDTAGQERFNSIISSYFRGAHLAILMIDNSNYKSFIRMNYWLKQIDNYAKKDIKIMCLINKTDLEAGIDRQEIIDKMNSIKLPFLFISVKENKNINSIYDLIYSQIKDLPIEEPKKDKIIKVNKNDKKCCLIM
jgi:Ras-related protein Rab-1A